MDWRFDQDQNAAAITTRQVIRDNLPILCVIHYSDDHSWAFTCGTTNESEDAMIVGMGEILERDSSLHEIADLPTGWSAHRESVGGKWFWKENKDV